MDNAPRSDSTAQVLNANPMDAWVLLPRKLTADMVYAWVHDEEGAESYHQLWDRLLAAAPPMPEGVASFEDAPRGWVWVPKALTAPMWKAWEQSSMVSDSIQEDYEALLAASPSPSKGRPVPVKPTPPSSRVLVERGLLGVKHFESQAHFEQWRAQPWWRRLFS